MKTIIIVSLLICSLFAFATAESHGSHGATTIKLDVFTQSNPWWLAVAVRDAGVATRSVQIQEDRSSSWKSMDYSSGWGYYTFSSNDRLNFPVSVRLISMNGDQVTLNDAINSISVGIVDTGVTYSSGSITPTSTPAATTRPTSVPTTKTPTTKAPTASPATKAPTTKAPSTTTRPTTAPATKAPTTKAPTTTKPTAAPATKAPTTKAPTTKAPTTTTKAPTTTKPTSAPSGGCSAPIKLMVPLYTYPGASWDAVAAGGRSVPTVAIINPNSGPGSGPDSSYNTYMNKLNSAGVEMVGYVHTSYGARAIATVKADIDVYASQFPHLVGIFLDEVAATADQVSYYQQLYSYIMGMPGWKYDIINPGTVPVQGYLNVATQIVSFEDVSSKFSASSNPSFASCSNKDKFSVITYGASSSGMQSAISTARSKGYYGWVYVTDGAGGCCTYNALTSYYASMVSYIASTN